VNDGENPQNEKMNRLSKFLINRRTSNHGGPDDGLGRLSRRDLFGLLAASWGATYAEGASLGPGRSRSANAKAGNNPAASAVRPRFESLRFGEVKPSGWIKAQMVRDLREGSAGHLDQLCAEASSDIFSSGRNRPGKLNVAKDGAPGGSWWNGETEGNWRSGLIMMAYLSEDPEAMRKADAWVHHILQSQDKNGYIGIYSPELRYSQSPVSGELWTQACVLRGLVAYYEFTGNVTVLNAIERAVKRTMSAYGPGKWTPFQVPDAGQGIAHGLMFTDVVSRLYELTRNAEYRDFGVRLYRDFSAGFHYVSQDATEASLLDIDKPFVGHGATTMEHLRVPLKENRRHLKRKRLGGKLCRVVGS
jgi:hypothetical protein